MSTDAFDPGRPAASRAAFGRLVGITAGRVGQLLEAGVLKRGDTLGSWLLGYCAHLRAQAAGRAKGGPLDLGQERAALAQEQRRMAEIKRLELRGELVSRAAVVKAEQIKASAVRESLLQVPAQLAPVVAAEDDIAKCQDAIADAMLHVLGRISAKAA